MANKNDIDVVGKNIILAQQPSDRSAIMTLEDGTIIQFTAVEHYDQMLGHWSTLKVDVFGS